MAVLVIVSLLGVLDVSFLLPKGNHSLAKSLVFNVEYTSIIIFILTYGVFAAAAEELIFRFLPYLLWKKKLPGINYWIYGTVVAVIFSVLHSIGSPGVVLAFPQLALGLYLWSYINKQNGYWQCFVAHLTFNATTLLLATYFVSVTG